MSGNITVCVNELHLSPNGAHQGLNFDRHVVPPPSTPNQFILSGKPLKAMVMEMEEIGKGHALMLDATLTAAHRASNEIEWRDSHEPQGQGVGGNINHCGYRKAAWSPVGLSRAGCLICAVTFDHQIQIIGQRGMRWIRLEDLTPIWHKYLTTEGKNVLESFSETLGKEKHHEFISTTMLLGISDITWTPLSGDAKSPSHAHLLVATASGHLVAWKVPYYGDDPFLQPEILNLFTLDKVESKISCLSYAEAEPDEGFLLVGTIKGGIEIYYLSLQPGQTSLKYLLSLPNISEGMSVNQLNFGKLPESGHYTLYSSKNNIFVCYLLQLTASGDKSRMIDSAHSITGCLNITGIITVNPFLLYISSKDGRIREYGINVNVQKKKVSITPGECILSSDNVHYDGFCVSPNKTFWAILETVSGSYDHLVLREPSVISIFQMNSLKSICDYLLSNTHIPLGRHVDLFECVRLLPFRDPSSRGHIPKVTEAEIENLEVEAKRTYLWFLEIIISSTPKSEETKEENDKMMALQKQLQNSILKDHAKSVLSALDKIPKDVEQRRSLLLMCTLLMKKRDSHPTLKNVFNQLKKSREDLEEKCLMCNSIIEFDNVHSAKCPKGHTLPRCFWTLLSTIPLIKCSHCNLFYDEKAHDWFADGDVCFICSRPLKSKVTHRRKESAPPSAPSKVTRKSPSKRKR